jgi:hypothetical protein
MDSDKTHGDEIVKHGNLSFFYIQELEEWIKSMYLLPEEFNFQRKRAFGRAQEKALQESGW